MKISIDFDPAWLSGTGLSRERGRALLRLLAELERSSSLREAARALGLSYRFAWGTLGDAARLFGAPLVEMQRGRGARLSPLGRKVVQTDARVRSTLAEHFDRLRSEIPAMLSQALSGSRARLTLHASHDLALPALVAVCAPELELDLVFRVSDDCLAALARGDCNLAGFHVADALPRAAAAAAAIGKWLDPRKHVLLHFVAREQGLIVRPGSRIRNVHDLTRPGVRFIHRQGPPDSAGEGKTSVALAVAEGRADAGFGLRAEARPYKLSFVTLAVERYFLACAKSSLRTAGMQTLLEALESAQVVALVAQLPGYDAAQAGKKQALDAALTLVEQPRR